MEIAVQTGGSDASRAKQVLSNELGFGRYFADLMFRAQFTDGKGWQDAAVVPYGPLTMDPAAMVLHYGQEIFEGQKAYRWEDGRIAMFRPESNADRFNRSAHRMVMPEVPVDLQVQATFKLVGMLREWVPPFPSSLYVRPTMIANEAALGVRPAKEYLYYIICSPVGPYFPKGFEPVRVNAVARYARAAEGGTGEAKTGGNYAGALRAQTEAKAAGYDQNLWLDAKEHRYAEEIGAMNILFVMEGAIVTPSLRGTILHGITRDSILKMARDQGLKVEERPVPIDEITAKIQDGRMSESFAAGTAAVITPVGAIAWEGKDYVIGDGRPGPMTQRMYKTLTDMQYGRGKDPYGWVKIVT
jgi:branched-chain amino acid aminotransferase